MTRFDDWWYVVGWLRGQQLVADGIADTEAPAPLQGRYEGALFADIFGDDQSDAAMDDYEDGYWDALVGHDNREVHDEV